MSRFFTFVGVTTAQSSIMRIFPRWRELLALPADVEVQGVDLPLHAEPERYRSVIEGIKRDPRHLGGLITTHKIDVYHAARDLFDGVDHYAELCGEVSCIAKRSGRLIGWAKDPISAGRSLERILGSGYFGRTGGHVLLFGAGGSSVAISLHLISQTGAGDRPQSIVITNRGLERLRALEALHGRIDSDVRVTYVHTAERTVHDRLLEELPPGSLVINATGMGKDTPGSPISDAATFPEGGVAWELNYRGGLDFLHQAWAQRNIRRVRVEDGWQYFIFGWTAVMEEVFERPIRPDELPKLSRAAAFARPTLPTTPAPSAPASDR